jgi:uncharacterized protein
MLAETTPAIELTSTEVTPAGFAAPVAATLPAMLERLVTRLRPHRVVLFGSYAYGRPTPDSDVDLLVVLESALPYAERYRLVSDIFWPRPFPADLIVLTPDEVEQKLAGGNPVLTEIMRRGRVLYEHPAATA